MTKSEISPKTAVEKIHTSLDKLVLKLEENPNLISSDKLLDALYSSHLALAKYYHQIPYEEAQKCEGRLRVMQYVMMDLLERKRIEVLIKMRDNPQQK